MNSTKEKSNIQISKQATSTTKTHDSKTRNVPKDIQPKRFGLRFDPSTIILEYLVPSTGKLYHHKMRLPQLKADSVTTEVVGYLKRKHFQFFINNKLPDRQLEQLIEKLKQKLKAKTSQQQKRPETASTMASSQQKMPSPALVNKAAQLQMNNQAKLKQADYEEYGIEDDDDDGMFDYAWNNKKQPQIANRVVKQSPMLYDEAYEEDDYYEEEEEEGQEQDDNDWNIEDDDADII